MLNARTWHRLCLSAYIAFPAVVFKILRPEKTALDWLVALAIGWAVIIAIWGAIQGIQLVREKLYYGCPRCDAGSHVVGRDKDGIYLDCSNCGELRMKLGSLFGLRSVLTNSEEDELAFDFARSQSPLTAFKRRPIPLFICMLPVVGSIIAASVIHSFSFFYLLIPGFWCFAVGGMIVDAFGDGVISDNGGTVVRSKSPKRFWGKLGLWALFYSLAAAFPIGYALQESTR